MKTFDEILEAIGRIRKDEKLNDVVKATEKRRAELKAKAIRKTSNVIFNFPEGHMLAKHQNGKKAKILSIRDGKCEMKINGYTYWITREHLTEVK